MPYARSSHRVLISFTSDRIKLATLKCDTENEWANEMEFMEINLCLAEFCFGFWSFKNKQFNHCR